MYKGKAAADFSIVARAGSNAFLIEFQQISQVKITLLIFSLALSLSASLSFCCCCCCCCVSRGKWQVEHAPCALALMLELKAACLLLPALGHARETHPYRDARERERESGRERAWESEASAQRAWKQKANIKQMFFMARPGEGREEWQHTLCVWQQKRNNELVGRLEVGNSDSVRAAHGNAAQSAAQSASAAQFAVSISISVAVAVAVSTKQNAEQTVGQQAAARKRCQSFVWHLARSLPLPLSLPLPHSLSLPPPLSAFTAAICFALPTAAQKIYDNAARS